MTHVNGHPVIDHMSHAFGIAPKHTHDVNQTQQNSQVQSKTLTEGDKVNVTTNKNQVVFGEHKHNVGKAESWIPFKSSQTGTAVGLMSGQVFGMVAGFGTAAVVGAISKNPKMAIATGASVYVASLASGAISGTIGYKARSMNVDTTEPPMGTMYDTPQQVTENIKKRDDVWKKALNK